MVRVIFVRHAQSAANAGLATDDFALIPVTALGEEQAEALARAWTGAPTHIFRSPFLRTHQTAAPTVARFSDVQVLELPVHEFTNLEPSRWNGTHPDERVKVVDDYWDACDAEYCDGPGAESFRTFYERMTVALEMLTKIPDGSVAYVFSHGFAMHMVRMQIRRPDLTPQQMMEIFVQAWNTEPIRNTERMELAYADGAWAVVRSTPPEAAVTASERHLL